MACPLSQGPGPPLGKPRRNLAYAYFGGGVSPQTTEVASMVIRTRHVGNAAAVITAFNIVSWSWPGNEHVEFHEDMVMSGGDLVEPLHQALHLMEHIFADHDGGQCV